MTNWMENDKLFFDQCRLGQKWQEYVGRYLNVRGVSVRVEPMTFRKDVSEAHKYVNTRDIQMTPGGVIEVKSRGLEFYCPETFPFPLPIIDTVTGYDQKSPKPLLYICVSRVTGCMIATRGDTPERWGTLTTKDSVRDIDVFNYVCPRHKWYSLDDFIPYAIQYQKELNTHDH